MTVLVLAGTSEARQLVAALVDDGVEVLASLAGRTSDALPLACTTRVGGFGGVDGLVRELEERGVTALVDATHPFADTMPLHARDAAARAGVPHLRLLRVAWHPEAGDEWTEVADERAAASSLIGGERALLALGRQALAPFTTRVDVDLVVRSVDAPPPGPWVDVLLGRGPFSYDDERAVLRDRRIEVLVTRNSGGSRAKLDAARDEGVRVVMIRRPLAPDLPTVADVAAARSWVQST